jgi:hypothetical protein
MTTPAQDDHPEFCYESIERMYAGDLFDAIKRAENDGRTWITDAQGRRVAAIVPAVDLEYWEHGI